jgi:hypothetical protein
VKAKRLIGNIVALGALIYTSGVVILRPWLRDWGSTTEERSALLPGDSFAGAPERAGDRAIAIDAPADRVWPWLLQLGEDRGGFYSYADLENAFGLHIVNAESIRPEWQSLAAGDFVRAVPPDWLGGMFGERVGWEVDQVDTTRHVLALRYWIFRVESSGEQSSRLHVRTHAGDAPLPVAPLLLLAFEPAHFIMERAMLQGIKQRAER